MSLTKYDLGKTPMRDPRTGDVYVDKDGNFITIERLELVMQECKVALKTIKGEDPFDVEWGFPLIEVINNPFNLSPEILITQAVKETLDPERIPMLESADVTSIREDEDNPGTWNVEVIIRSINQEDILIGVDTIGRGS